MGGFGSGRQQYATTPTVEECRHLDVDQFTDAVEHPGRGGSVNWGDPDDPVASITVVMLSADHVAALKDGEKLEAVSVEDADTDPDDVHDDDERATAVYLSYTITAPRSDESRDVSYHVPLEYTECNFGGVRPWFRCPGVVDERECGRRVGKLYKPPRQDLYLCRHCYNLGYQSSRTSGMEMERAEQRYRKAFAKADAENRRPHPNNAPFLPDRPKGMHHDTFEDLVTDIEAARDEWHVAFIEEMRAISDRADSSLD
jgi:hypothetical protein